MQQMDILASLCFVGNKCTNFLNTSMATKIYSELALPMGRGPKKSIVTKSPFFVLKKILIKMF